jgi:glycosyltransferase involved in cell wall biosynthesis
MLELSEHTADPPGVPRVAEGELSGTRILAVMPTIPLHGMERKTLKIMSGLRERGADVLFITQKDYGQSVQRAVEDIGCQWVAASFDQLLHLPRGPREAATLLASWWTSASELNRIRRAYRPTHIHIPNMTLFLYSWPTLLRAPETIVFALPNPPDTSFTGFRRHLNSFIWRHGVQRVCDRIVCNSAFTLAQVRAVGLTSERLSLIYNSAPYRTPGAGDAPVVDRSKMNVAYIGRICTDKGVREYIDAALCITSERTDVDFYLAGDVEWRNPFAKALIEELKVKGLTSRIHFLGEINDVTELLAQCDVHVCPSICEEAFGLVVLEAKSRSVPSVVFPSGGLTETVRHLVDGYVCPSKTSSALYDGIRHFLDDPVAMRKAGREAHRSLADFSERKAADAWASLFKQPKRVDRVAFTEPSVAAERQPT